MAWQTHDRIGPYEIVAPIGAGGMGEVYRARDVRLGRDVAIKCLPDAFASDPDRLMRFEREARTLASLNQLHIAQVYGLEQAGTTRALVMELVDGEDLSTRIARGPLPLDEALGIARQIAEALEAAHAHGIIHRDLKPANVKVKDDGTVKVLDFGLAKSVERAGGAGRAGEAGDEVLNSPTITSPAMTMGGVILGTAAYMAPEQAKGKAVDKRADIWAFGCVLYEMLTGRRAFDGEDVSDTLAAILRGDPDWSALPPLPPALMLLLKRCLDRDLRRRVGDMAAVRFVLDDVAALTPAPVHVRDAVAPSARRQPSLRLLAALASVAVIAAALAVFAVARARERTSAPAPVTRFALSLPQGQVLAVTRRMTSMSPDGQSLAYVSENRLFLRRFAQFEPELVPAVDLGLAITSPTFSPDGAWLAFHAGSQNAVKRVSTRGGAAVRVCDTQLPVTISWEAGGILLGMGSGGVLRCNPAGGAPEQLVRAEQGELIISPQLLSDDAVLFTSARTSEDAGARWDKADVVVHSLETGSRKVVFASGSDARVVSTGHLIYRYGGILYAVPFDVATQQVHGDAVAVIEGVLRASTGPTQMSLAANGTIAYLPGPTGVSGGERQLAIGDRAGVVTRVPLAPGPYVHVRVSPDGNQVALGSESSDVSVWVYPLDGTSALRRLTLTGRNRFPIWSPDGVWIAFASERDGTRGIFRQRADGTGGAERLTAAAAGETHTPESWSRDGGYLSYGVQAAAGAEHALWVLSLADRKAAPFAGVKSIQPIGSMFSPDGRWLAYGRITADDISSPERGVFVQPFPATGTILQAPRQQVDFHPMWTRDGNELIFLASTTARQMAAMRVTARASTLTFGAPARFPASVTGDKLSTEPRSFDILPDGRLIGLIGPADGGSGAAFAELRVVTNWFQELAQRVPVKN